MMREESYEGPSTLLSVYLRQRLYIILRNRIAMKNGPYRIRLGHHDVEGKKLDWIDELGRFSSIGTKYARCSFYVPVLTPVVIMLMVDPAQQRTDPTAVRMPIRINISAGSDSFSDTITSSDNTVRLYGANVSSTPFEGKDVPIQASEQIIEIAITEEDGMRELATFEFMHLESDKVPEHIELTHVHTNKELQPWTYDSDSNDALTAERHNRLEESGEEQQAKEEQEVDELMESDEEFSIIDEVVKSPNSFKAQQKQQPSTPVKKIAVRTSLTPQFNKMGTQSTPKVKIEMPELQISPHKPPTPAHLVKKETLRKVAALERELKAANGDSKTLSVTLKNKEAKAKAALNRAVRRAQEEYDAALQRNHEMKEELESQLEEQRETLKWVQQVINDNTEVIELSDSDGDIAQLLAHDSSSESEDEEISSTSTVPSPSKKAKVSL